VVELTKLDDRRHGLAVVQSLEAQQLFIGGGDKLFDSNNDQYFFTDTTLSYIPGQSEFPAVPTGVFAYSTKCYSYGCVPGDATCYSYLCPNRSNIVRRCSFLHIRICESTILRKPRVDAYFQFIGFLDQRPRTQQQWFNFDFKSGKGVGQLCSRKCRCCGVKEGEESSGGYF